MEQSPLCGVGFSRGWRLICKLEGFFQVDVVFGWLHCILLILSIFILFIPPILIQWTVCYFGNVWFDYSIHTTSITNRLLNTWRWSGFKKPGDSGFKCHSHWDKTRLDPIWCWFDRSQYFTLLMLEIDWSCVAELKIPVMGAHPSCLRWLCVGYMQCIHPLCSCLGSKCVCILRWK